MLMAELSISLQTKLWLRARPLSTTGATSVARRDDSRVFDHEDYRPLRGTRSMQDALWDDGALPRSKFHRAAFEIDEQLPCDYVEEFVIIIVFVPVIFALHHAK